MTAVRWTSALAAAALLGAGIGLAPERPVTDVYFGTSVVDPYRYMESDGDPTFVQWRSAQLERTRAMFAAIPGRASLEAEVRRSASPARIENLTCVRDRVFFERSANGRTSIFVKDLSGGPERAIVDPTTFSAADDSLRVGAFSISPDGQLLAYHADGPNVSAIHIVRVTDGSLVEPPIERTVFDTVGFTSDSANLIYDGVLKTMAGASMDAQARASRVFLHRLGTPQAGDVAIFGTGVTGSAPFPPTAFAFVDAPAGSTKAIAEVRDPSAIGSQFYVTEQRALGSPRTVWRPLGTRDDAFTDYAVRGSTIELATQRDAPNYRVVRAALDGPFRPVTVLPGSQTAVVSGTLDGIPKAGIFALNDARDATYVQVLDHGIVRLLRIPFGKGRAVSDVRLPADASVLAVATDPRRDGALVDLTSWTKPKDVYAFRPDAAELHALGVKPSQRGVTRVAETVVARAADGTAVPVSLVYDPRGRLARPRPLLLRVTGAYGFSTTPDYDLVPEPWLANDGIFAVAHVRGGGELGERWHDAGRGARKPNTWGDLIAAAQLVIARDYTSPAQLDLYGPTASYLGGTGASIAIGRAITERPDLFAAAVVDAPGFDLLRSETTDVGKQSVPEFGSTADRAGFDALFAMSPYEHVRAGVRYPRLLARSFSQFGLGADWEAAKMVARLQAAAGSEDAAYLDVLHDREDDRRDRIARDADLYAFLLSQDGAPGFQPKQP